MAKIILFQPKGLDMYIFRYLIIAAILSACTVSFAQDLHFSQFYLNPQQLTPAATGMFAGNFRAGGIYRSQWASVPVSYQTLGASCDWKAVKRPTSILALGMLLEQDKAGDAAMKWSQVGVNVSAIRALGESQAISAGFGLNVVQRSFDINELTFKNQWLDGSYHSGLPSKETFNSSSGLKPSLSAGIAWQLQPQGNRSGLNIGIGAWHLNKPAVNFTGDDSWRLPQRFSVYANGALQLNTRMDVVAFAMGQQMDKAREIVAGAGVRYILSSGPGNETNIQFSMASRLGDALIPAVLVQRNNWAVGFSYDINTSDLNIASDGHGALEIGVVYRTVPVPPLKTFKACPIF